MKKIYSILIILMFVSIAAITSCKTPAQKVASAKKDVREANKDLDKAQEVYMAEVQAYRRETADRISANDRSIAEFRTRIENEREDVKADYRRRIAVLEQKNSDSKRRMDDYKADGREKWQNFKMEFNRDMDELGKALKDLTVKNNK